MRHIHARPAGPPAIALSLLLAGCGGGSGGGEESLVVDLGDPAFAGPQGAAPAPAPAPAPEAAEEARPLPGAPGGFSPIAGRDADPGDEPGPSGEAPAPAAAASPIGLADGGAAGDTALKEMLAAATAASDPEAPRGRSEFAMDPGQSETGMMDDYAFEAGPGDMVGRNDGAMGEFDVGDFYGDVGAGGFDDFGNPGADSAKPGDFTSPQGAVKAFLDAIKARDIQRMHEATALRAPVEAETAARRRTFQAIREMSLGEDELDSISKDLEDFQIAQMSRPSASNVVRFILRKQGEYGSTLQRYIDVRKERTGWKISDVTAAAEIKQVGGRAMELRNRRRNQGGDTGGGGFDGSFP